MLVRIGSFLNFLKVVQHLVMMEWHITFHTSQTKQKICLETEQSATVNISSNNLNRTCNKKKSEKIIHFLYFFFPVLF